MFRSSKTYMLISFAFPHIQRISYIESLCLPRICSNTFGNMSCNKFTTSQYGIMRVIFMFATFFYTENYEHCFSPHYFLLIVPKEVIPCFIRLQELEHTCASIQT